MQYSFNWVAALLASLTLFLPERGYGLTYTPCAIPSKIQGTWDIKDSTGAVDTTVTISSSSLNGVTFWSKTLDYNCYVQSSYYYVFVSEVTDLFSNYDVHIYFCWYLLQESGTKYRLYELTDKVLLSIEQRAKAYMNTTTPTVNDICEVSFDTSLSYNTLELANNAVPMSTVPPMLYLSLPLSLFLLFS